MMNMDDTRHARLLIVDDEAALMRSLCDTLRDHGYETMGFTSALEALEALRAGGFDLLLADLAMPEMDGITLLREALRIDGLLVGVIMTGDGTIGTAVEAMRSSRSVRSCRCCNVGSRCARCAPRTPNSNAGFASAPPSWSSPTENSTRSHARRRTTCVHRWPTWRA
jgi:CheY-like chemotaxis protein